jgi:hypothetical protein
MAEVKPQDQRETGPIQDNSLLLEEAYNQEGGVIQHIAYFRIQPQTGDWVYAQTEEWPLRSLKHQFSVTLSAAYDGSLPGSRGGWGVTAVNYRYQLVGSGESRVAVAPRLSLLVPSGNPMLYGRGAGGTGVQTNLPISIQHSRHWVTNWNVGATWVPGVLATRRTIASTAGINLGQSVVWLATLKALAPTQSEPPFLVTQLIVMVIFIGLSVFAA